MKIRIDRETGRVPLDEQKLLERVQMDGFAVFASGRVRQRKVAHALVEMLETEGIEAVSGEASGPNGCMCVVDIERCTLSEITVAAAQEDCAYEDGTPGS